MSTPLEFEPIQVIAASLILALGGALLWRMATRNGFQWPTLVSLVIQSASSIALLEFGSHLQGDAAAYHEGALAVLDGWQRGSFADNPFMLGKMSLVWIAAFTYYLVGPSPVIPVLLLVLLVSAMPILLGTATLNFGFPHASRLAAWLGALSPQILIWSPWLRREGLSFFLLATAMLGISYVFRNRLATGLMLVLVSCALFLITRPQLIFSVLAAFLVAAVVELRNKFALRSILFFVVGVVTLVILGVLSFVQPQTSALIDEDALQTLNASNSAPSQGLAVPWVQDDYWADPATTESIAATSENDAVGHSRGFEERLLELPRRFSEAAWGPPPWAWNSVGLALVGLDGSLWFVIYVVALGLYLKNRYSRALVLSSMAAIATLTLGAAVALDNYGILLRIRAHAWILAIPMVAVAAKLLGEKFWLGKSHVARMR